MEPSFRQETSDERQAGPELLTATHLHPSAFCLILLIGWPVGENTTLARQLISQCPDCWLISTDAIRAQLFGDEAIQGPWMQVWREVQRQFRQAAHPSDSGMKQTAIYDATNVMRKQRRRVLSLAREAGFTQIVGVWLDVPLGVCLSRNQQRDRQVPEWVMQKMYRQLTGAPPALIEGFDRLVRTVSLSQVDLRQLLICFPETNCS